MEQITMDELRRAFCEMAMEAVRETVLNTAEDGTAFYWYIAGGAEILRLAEKLIAEQTEEREQIVEATFYGDGQAKKTIRAHVEPRNETDGGQEPTGKYL